MFKNIFLMFGNNNGFSFRNNQLNFHILIIIIRGNVWG